MVSIAQAMALVLGEVGRMGTERVPLAGASGRILAEVVHAPFDVPGFANSQMDGFAARATDLARARETAPVALPVTATVAAGRPLESPVEPGTCVRIMTGAAVPPGADTVVPIEDAVAEGAMVRFTAPSPPGRFVRPAGEDLACGEAILQRGRCLRPPDIGVLASIGCVEVPVSLRPRVAIVGTGDELVPIGRPLGPGQIHDSNAYTLAAAVEALGGVADRLGIVADDRESLRAMLQEAARYDCVLSTGGVSVGDFDYVKEVMDELGLRRRFWRVAQKPGKPLTFAAQPGCLYFGLPGNPVSAMVCFHLYVAPALRASLGRPDIFPATVEVTVAEEMRTAGSLMELVRCRLEREGDRLTARPTGTQSSGALRSLSLADALVLSPPGQDRLRAGDRALALRLHPAEALSTAHPFG